MLTTLFLQYWKQLLLAAIVITASWALYDKAYSVGYIKASAEYEVKLREYDDKLRDRINNIELNSAVIIEQFGKGREAAAKEYKNILAAARTKPLVIYQNGTCEISPDFSKAYVEALKRANKK